MHLRPLKWVSSLCTLSLAASSWSCGQNLFKSTEAADPAEDATLALERDDANAAINTLEKKLASDPGNPQYLSILAAAYAQRAGIEPLRLAQNISNASDSNSTSQLTGMFGFFGAVNEQILADIDHALDILLNDIAVDQRQPGDDFKIAIYQTSSLVLHLKILDLNGDGQITPDEILDLSDLSASGILSQLGNAQVLLAASGVSNKQAQKLAEKIASYQTSIDTQDGASDAERLRNYLAANGSSTPSTTP